MPADDQHLGVWCPGCSADVSGPCHHFNCAIGPNAHASAVHTLVLCKDLRQAVEAAKVIGNARYEVWSAPLTGSRFQRIIWLAGFGESASERSTIARIIREHLPTKLVPGGDLIVL